MYNQKIMPKVYVTNETLHEEHRATMKALAAHALEVTSSTAFKGYPIFKVAPTASMSDTYLMHFNAEDRQHYNCAACKHFLRKYGTLVTIDATGNMESLIWDPDVAVGETFKQIVSNLKQIVERGEIIDVLRSNLDNSRSDETKYSGLEMCSLGDLGSDEYLHLHADINYKNMKVFSLKKIPSIESTNDIYRVCVATLNRWKLETIKDCYTLANIGKLNKEESKSRLNLLMQIVEDITNTKNLKLRNGKRWLYAFKYKDVLYGFASSVEGALLDDYSEGYDVDTCIERYNKYVDPINYKRPTSLPTGTLVKEAEKIIADLGLADSLKRRIAKFDDVKDFIWRPAEEKKQDEVTGVFGNVKTSDNKSSNKANTKMDLTRSQTTMTLTKFMKEVAPRATKMFLRFSASKVYPFFTFTTEAIEGSKPIMVHDKEDNRNPLSMYTYYSGSFATSFNIYSALVEVLGVTRSPENMKNHMEHPDYYYAFILKNCRDLKMNGGSGLFPDLLIKELYPVRKVIEEYSKNTPIEDIDKYTQAAAGLCMCGKNINMEVRVETENTIEAYLIDRME